MVYVPRKSGSYLDARHKMLTRIESMAAAGEMRLPGLRDLAKELGVSFMTANKTLRRLAAEGRLRVVPCKGYFIPDNPERLLQIGIVMGRADDLTMIRNPPIFAGLIETLRVAGCYVRIIQAAEQARAIQLLKDEGADACIWYFPQLSQLPQLKQAWTRLGLPSLVLDNDDWNRVKDSELPPVHVALDHRATARSRAEFLLARGHRAIASLNGDYLHNSSSAEAFASRMAEAGVKLKASWCIKTEDVEAQLPKLLDEGEITAAVVFGLPEHAGNVFRIVAGHPLGKHLELLPDSFLDCRMRELLKSYSQLHVAGINVSPGREFGVTAARILLRNIFQGEKMSSARLPAKIMDVESFSRLCAWEGNV